MKGKNIVFWLIGVKTILVTLLQAMLIPLMMWANSLFNGFSLFEGRNINGELFNIYVYVGVVSVEVLITNILIAIHTHLGGNTNANL